MSSYFNVVRTSSLLMAGLAFSACTQSGFSPRYGIDPQAAVKADGIVSHSLAGVSTGALGTTDNQANIVIQRSALGKEFLLMGELIQQQPAPSFNGLKSHVVIFQENNGKVQMLDSNVGHSITNDLPQDLVLAEFNEVTSTDPNSITVDFNKGMSNIFADGDWYAQDEAGTTYNYTLSDVKANFSYVKSAKISPASNTLVIDQVLQVTQVDPTAGPQLLPVTVKYYLSPYNPDPSFQPELSDRLNMKTFGYFEVAPQLYPDGSSFIRVTKWNVNQPVVYAISANTPKDFVQPITDAVLYWNSVFGQQVVQVIQLTDKSITAPNPDYNIIQWVENDAAGAAYADAQMDPRSGQILHAQIYLTSVFGDLGKIRAQKDLRDAASGVNSGNGSSSRSSRKFYSFKGFAQTGLCDLEVSRAVGHTDFVGLTKALDPAAILKVSQDYVRETVAHEVGHTLGLRHNFAGNLGGNLDLSQKEKLYSQYLQNGQTPDGVNTTSSIMDYELFEESTLTGDQVRRQVAHLDYDIKAIQHLYYGAVPESVPPFCTDGDLKKYQDCAQFDAGRSLPEYLAWNNKFYMQDAAVAALNLYITNKAPTSMATASVPVEDLAIDPTDLALETMQPLFPVYRSLTKAGSLIAVQASYPFINAINASIVVQAQQTYLSKQFGNVGGLVANYAPVDDNLAANALAKFTQLLETPGYGSGTFNGVDYSFSDAEKKVMTANAKLFFETLQKQLTMLDLMSLTGAPEPQSPDQPQTAPSPANDPEPLLAGPNGDQMLEVIKARIEKYVLTTTTEVLTVKLNIAVTDSTGHQKLKPTTVKLPVFKYSQDLRLATASLIGKGHSTDLAWGSQAKNLYGEALAGIVAKAIGTQLSNVDMDSAPAEAVEWLTNNSAVLGILTN